MARKHASNPRERTRRQSAGPVTQAPPRSRERTALPGAPALQLWLGAALLLAAAVLSLLLVMEHFGGLQLPGCGAGSACAEAANSVWGKLRLGDFAWPVSFLGLAYFAGVLATWLVLRGALPWLFVYLVRAGAAISLLYSGLMLYEHLLCPYCVAVHVCNLAFWILLEWTRVPSQRLAPGLVSFGAAFAGVSLALSVANAAVTSRVTAKAETDRDASVRQMIERAVQAKTAATGPSVATGPSTTAGGSTTPGPATATAAGPATAPHAPREFKRWDRWPEGRVFTGRHRLGDEDAPIRIVMYTGYQCPDCQMLERQLERVVDDYRNMVSVSIKHFPFNHECNPFAPRSLHPNACWAARAAEAAGILYGPEGFWTVHKWLFSRQGVFETEAELEEGIRNLGLDTNGFIDVMGSHHTLEVIREDVDEARQLGLFFTPMVFINGVELKGWHAQNALDRTVTELVQANPPRQSAALDRPAVAMDKYVSDWQEQPVQTMPEDKPAWSLGPADAPVQVVVFGDYQEQGTQAVDAILRAFVSKYPKLRYTYRHFPFNNDCNPRISDKRHPNACRAARAAEAAGRLGGEAAFWKVHEWLMAHTASLSDGGLRDAATRAGLEPSAFLAAIDQPESVAAVKQDTDAGMLFPQLRLGAPAGIFGVPSIFINGKYVPRWKMDEDPVIERLLEVALVQGS